MQNNSASIIGAWRLIAFEFRKADGNIIYPFGEKARGSIIYTETGRYSAQLMRVDRPRFSSGDQMQGTVEEMEANYKGCISYFGTYDINPQDSLIIHHVEGSIFPNMEGRDQERFFELSEHRLQLTTPPIKLDGVKTVGVLLWERIG
ncbi:MAG TPA: lipocalin-like domain-containing protein [Anaerolineales bacterium]|nr:lipocalin-like domain-containing protein [Anaerolineales bacterium]